MKELSTQAVCNMSVLIKSVEPYHVGTVYQSQSNTGSHVVD